jgi:hypothetical protein
MGIREFRDNITSIARDATETVIVTNHDKIVGWFTPAKRPPPTMEDFLRGLEDIRRRAEARGVDVAGKMRELGLEDDRLFEDPLREAVPAKSRPKAKRKRAK